MNVTTIKGLDKKVSRVVMGTGWFAPEFKTVIYDLLDRYVAAGGNVIDTGRFYNGGKSEAIITEWLNDRKNRDQLIIINKACHHYVDENNVHYPEKSRVKPEYITEDLEYSLQNMGVDYFDIYLLHRDDVNEPVSGLMDTLEKHHLEGKIKTYGMSNWSNERIQEAVSYCKSKGYTGIRVNSPSYSLATINKPRWVGTVYVDADYVQSSNEEGITILSWAAQSAGFFVPLWSSIDSEAPEDIKNAYFTEDNFKKLNRVIEVATKRGGGIEPVNVALAYVLHPRFNVFASIGPRNMHELESSLKALDIELTKQEIEYLELKTDKCV
ncbi:hypothetical protein AOC36_09730 [Erysipelothrix larvae]|uniref:NADP-dependent oxidoreductase domain-containing protein n=1 Tax=Erysipelothrix larvae TaxID=1514105 RepID=A0A0X8H1C5_9FIRM|nr:aldo/keto reductase [Erysipelothrix larvae]AMC94252.1 hypothetical protein AOC36_09730 [Erysipelothrix larvae]